MRKIFISAGHTNVPGKDRGAVGNGYIEGDEAVKLRDSIVKNLKSLGGNVTVDSNSNALTHSLNYFKTLTSPDSIVVDIHFNAGPSSATGTETLIPSQNTEFERNLAFDLSYQISKTLSIPLRGNYKGLKGVRTEAESHHGSLGWMRLNGENILLEICFISNKNDMESYKKNFDALSCVISQTLFSYAIKDKPTEVKFHLVVSGDTLSKIANKYGTTTKRLQEINKLSSPNKIYIGQTIKLK